MTLLYSFEVFFTYFNAVQMALDMMIGLTRMRCNKERKETQ
jgi:hypothetical protein